MKRFLLHIIAFVSLIGIGQSAIPAQSAGAISVNDFYFKNAEYDYYLERAEDGTSNLHVKETLTAVFPDTDQNHGITRSIPYTNQNGKNLTVDGYDALNLRVSRNGQPESIAKHEEENNHYVIYIGRASSYVHGEQTYVLEYDFKNVITAFDKAGNLTTSSDAAVQELYWDTNGTGWRQRFERLTARVHLPDDLADKMISGTSCYVGYYGDSGSNRCTISADDETTYNRTAANSISGKASETVITFSTSNLSASENLTFVIDFSGDTFVVPGPRPSYLALIIAGLTIILAGLSILWMVLSYEKHLKSKVKHRKNQFKKPEYAPPKNFTVGEAAVVGIGITKSSRVATLLEMAIKKHISIIKTDGKGLFKKNSWQVKVNNTTGLLTHELDVLKIINGGDTPKDGDTITIKKHTATLSLERTNRDYDQSIKSRLSSKGFLESKGAQGTTASIVVMTVWIMLLAFAWPMITVIISDPFHEVVAAVPSMITIGFLAAAVIVLAIIFTSLGNKYGKRTIAGLDMATYLDGLKLYISMAETDRIKFLQSVKGVDTSDKGLCKLYEKLLPYACIFGLEESWLKELNKYYEIADYNSGWYSGTDIMTFAMLDSMMSSTRQVIASSTSYTTSSSGSSSSSFGGGGGGFSGGGGGGGGGGGW